MHHDNFNEIAAEGATLDFEARGWRLISLMNLAEMLHVAAGLSGPKS